MKAGDRVAGRYEILRPGKGGASGMVYEAIDLRDDRQVALKVVTDRGDESYAIRVEREIKILASLSHPHVVEYLDSGYLPDGRIFVALEWLEGEDLATALERTSLPLGFALHIVKQAADGLAAAHALGVVHRDIKPANVFLLGGAEVSPEVRVLDFGVAKSFEEEGNVTRAGAILGTAFYMAPEQAQRAKHADARADVFGLGVVLYEVVTGHLPWRSRTPYARLARISTEPAISLRLMSPSVPVSVADLAERMLTLDPDARIATMDEVVVRTTQILRSLSTEELEASYGATREAVQALADPVSSLGESKSSLGGPITEDAPPRHKSMRRKASLPTELVVGPVELTPVGVPVVGDLPRAMPDPHSLTSERRPMIGQSRLVERLRGQISTAIQNKKPGLIVVSGPAGIGKTRLRVQLTEILKSGRELVVLAGRAEEAMRTVPDSFVGRLLLREARIFSDDPPDVRHTKLRSLMPSPEFVSNRLQKGEGVGTHSVRSHLSEQHTRHLQIDGWTARPSIVAALSDAFDWEGEHDPDAAADFELVASFFAEALGVSPNEGRALEAARRDPLLMAGETRRALDIVLSGMATDGGLVVLVDDAHFLDAQSARVLRELVAAGRERPIAVVLFTMPKLLDVVWSGAPISAIEVPPLDPQACRELAESTAGGRIDPDALEALQQRASGSPLFLVQLVLACIESGALALNASSRFVFTTDPRSSESIPSTVAAAVRERLRVLAAEDQKALAAAATMGDVFWVEGVARLLAEPLKSVTERFERLGRQDFVRPRPISRYRGQHEMELAHGVLKSVILSKVKKSSRELFELGTLEYLQSVHEVEHAVLADHATEAGRGVEAVRWWIAAARQSLAAGATASALAQVERGLAISELDVDARADLFEVGAQAARLNDDPVVAESHLQSLLALELSEGRRAAGEILAAELELTRGHLEAAHGHADMAGETMDGSSTMASELQVLKAEIAEQAGDERGALRMLLRPSGEREDARTVAGRSAAALARIALSSTDYRTAESRFREALVAGRAKHDVDLTRGALVGLAEVARRCGRPDRANDYLLGAERLVRVPIDELMIRIRRGLLLAENEELDRARWVFDDVERSAARFPTARILASLAWAKVAVGFGTEELPSAPNLKTSIASLERSIAEAKTTAPKLLTSLTACLGLFHAATGVVEKGLEESRAAIASFLESGSLTEDEPARLLLCHARTLSLARAPLADVRGALRGAVEQLDLTASRLERNVRADLLKRPLAKTILRAAKSAGIEVKRDEASHRLKISG
ncbi:MAG: protein kinase [Deltaproteobacteria bacterium]|nr:protein kinase [Deltaproteobacteria bacterium]